MCQTLLFIPREVAGVPLFGLGLLLGLWLAVGGGWLGWQVLVRGRVAELWSFVPMWLVFAGVIGWLLPRIAEPEGLPIRGYGTLVVAAVIAGTWLAMLQGKRAGVSVETITSLAFWMFVVGIAGARLFYVVEYWDEYREPSLGQTMANVLKLTEGGLVVYGAVVGALAVMFVLIRAWQLPVWTIADIAAPAGALAMGIGRLGCLLNGCCYGGETSLPVGLRFPHGSPPFAHQVEQGELSVHGLYLERTPTAAARIRGVEPHSDAARAGLQAGQQIARVNGLAVRTAGQALAALLQVHRGGQMLEIQTVEDQAPHRWQLPARLPRSRPVHPTQLYSALDGLLLCGLLLAYGPLKRRDGEVLALFLTLYAITRFLLEILRDDEPAIFRTGLTISQNVSLLVLAVAVGLWLYLARLPRRLHGTPLTH